MQGAIHPILPPVPRHLVLVGDYDTRRREPGPIDDINGDSDVNGVFSSMGAVPRASTPDRCASDHTEARERAPTSMESLPSGPWSSEDAGVEVCGSRRRPRDEIIRGGSRWAVPTLRPPLVVAVDTSERMGVIAYLLRHRGVHHQVHELAQGPERVGEGLAARAGVLRYEGVACPECGPK